VRLVSYSGPNLTEHERDAAISLDVACALHRRRPGWMLVTPAGVRTSWSFPARLRVRAVAEGYVAATQSLESGVQVLMIYRLMGR